MTTEAAAPTRLDKRLGASDAKSRPLGWRLSTGHRKLALSAHVVISVGLFGIYAAMLMLAIAGATTADPETSRAAYRAMGLLKGAVPLGAVGVVVTGVVLSLGTSWGLFQHLWVVAKLVLTVAALPISILLVFPSIQQAIAVHDPGPAAPSLLAASGAIVLMLGAATVIAVYKPWGTITRARHRATGASQPRRDV